MLLTVVFSLFIWHSVPFVAAAIIGLQKILMILPILYFAIIFANGQGEFVTAPVDYLSLGHHKWSQPKNYCRSDFQIFEAICNSHFVDPTTWIRPFFWLGEKKSRQKKSLKTIRYSGYGLYHAVRMLAVVMFNVDCEYGCILYMSALYTFSSYMMMAPIQISRYDSVLKRNMETIKYR